jgi:hypothetical protein
MRGGVDQQGWEMKKAGGKKKKKKKKKKSTTHTLEVWDGVRDAVGRDPEPVLDFCARAGAIAVPPRPRSGWSLAAGAGDEGAPPPPPPRRPSFLARSGAPLIFFVFPEIFGGN